MLSSVKSPEITLQLNELIATVLKVTSAAENKQIEEINQQLKTLREKALLLPPISTQSQLEYISDIIASVCLFIVALALSVFAGHLFYVACHGVFAHYLLDELIGISATFIIPFGLMGLFANKVAHSVKDENASIDSLINKIVDKFSQLNGELHDYPELSSKRADDLDRAWKPPVT